MNANDVRHNIMHDRGLVNAHTSSRAVGTAEHRFLEHETSTHASSLITAVPNIAIDQGRILNQREVQELSVEDESILQIRSGSAVSSTVLAPLLGVLTVCLAVPVFVLWHRKIYQATYSAKRLSNFDHEQAPRLRTAPVHSAIRPPAPVQATGPRARGDDAPTRARGTSSVPARDLELPSDGSAPPPIEGVSGAVVVDRLTTPPCGETTNTRPEGTRPSDIDPEPPLEFSTVTPFPYTERVQRAGPREKPRAGEIPASLIQDNAANSQHSLGATGDVVTVSAHSEAAAPPPISIAVSEITAELQVRLADMEARFRIIESAADGGMNPPPAYE
ncbi:unnamed protein product [Mycena citricolor]|uniref:Transmembrane protein n=1 Tax=Mycena citricolor TaxID=2018698 RepID=A0AAD2I2D6_9AGAR|nr:unnamed protein product [Mycena citricolor]